MFIKLLLNLLFPQTELEKECVDILSGKTPLQEHYSLSQRHGYTLLSFFPYSSPKIRMLIWQLKYRNNYKIGIFFAQKIYDLLCEELSEQALIQNFSLPILIPIPSNFKRRVKRGYNQTEIIGGELQKLDSERFFKYSPRVLYRIKDNKKQAQLKDRKSREQNIKDSFVVKDNSIIYGQNIILFDDVITTGATLREASHVLKKAGAKKILWITVAH